MTKPFDLEAAKGGEPVQTRDGRKVRLLCFDAEIKTRPIVGLVKMGSAEEWLSNWPVSGVCGQSVGSDLVMATVKLQRERWVNVYEDGEVMHISKKAADSSVFTRPRLACVRVLLEWEE